MLSEIFQNIIDDIHQYLGEKRGKKDRVTILMGKPGKNAKDTWIRLELLRFGAGHDRTGYVHESPADKSFYNFTFFITAHSTHYMDCLELTEQVCEHFDKRPFVQLKVREKEYEVAISGMELTIDELNHFWLARREPHQPTLFYQARISEV